MAPEAGTAAARYVSIINNNCTSSYGSKQLEARRHGSGSRDRRSTVGVRPSVIVSPPASDLFNQLEARRHGSGSRDRRSTVRYFQIAKLHPF